MTPVALVEREHREDAAILKGHNPRPSPRWAPVGGDGCRTTGPVLGVTAVLQAVSLAALVLSRTDSVFGWSEPAWTRGADQIRAVEVGALVCLAQVAGLRLIMLRRSGPTPAIEMSTAPRVT